MIIAINLTVLFLTACVVACKPVSQQETVVIPLSVTERQTTVEAVETLSPKPAPQPDVEKEVVKEVEEEAHDDQRAASAFTPKYDGSFKKWSKRFLPFLDWRWVKAQCYQESLLKVDAVSPVGAMGLCQFMPGTWDDVSDRLSFSQRASAFDPELSIQAATYYDGVLWGQWSSPRPDEDRLFLVFASYNAGLGNLLKAQKACGGPNLYKDIIHCLQDITGHHSKETKTYVVRIQRWYKQMLFE